MIKQSSERRVIAFSVWGYAQAYLQGMMRNMCLVADAYPGWDVRIYITDGHMWARDFVDMGAEVVECEPDPRWNAWQGLYWRMRVALDPSVDRWIIRDADSRLNARGAAAVQAWIDSGKSYHVMHDDTLHIFGGNGHKLRAILGGMWGGMHSPWLGPIMDACPHRSRYGDDETMLTNHVWPLIKDDCLCHGVETPWTPAGEWPEHEPIDGFVGEKVAI